MDSIRKDVRPHASLLAVMMLGCAGLPLLAGCARQIALQPTMMPPFATRPITSVPRAEIVAYADRLDFVTDLAMGDSQPLLVPPTTPGGPPTLGPWAKIEAERGAASLTRDQMATGRIIARIWSEGVYDSLGLARGFHYLWVERVGGQWTAHMIPRDQARPPRPLPFAIQPEPGRSPEFRRVPRARWYYNPNPGSAGWINCNGDCCIVCSAGSKTCSHP